MGKLNWDDRLLLYNKLKVGDRVKIIHGKNKNKIGEITSISKIQNNEYNSERCIHHYSNYFSVRIKLDNGIKTSTSCDYIKLLKDKTKKESGAMELNFDIEKFKEDFYNDNIKVRFRSYNMAYKFAFENLYAGKWKINETIHGVILSAHMLDGLMGVVNSEKLDIKYPLKPKNPI